MRARLEAKRAFGVRQRSRLESAVSFGGLAADLRAETSRRFRAEIRFGVCLLRALGLKQNAFGVLDFRAQIIDLTSDAVLISNKSHLGHTGICGN